MSDNKFQAPQAAEAPVLLDFKANGFTVLPFSRLSLTAFCILTGYLTIVAIVLLPILYGLTMESLFQMPYRLRLWRQRYFVYVMLWGIPVVMSAAVAIGYRYFNTRYNRLGIRSTTIWNAFYAVYWETLSGWQQRRVLWVTYLVLKTNNGAPRLWILLSAPYVDQLVEDLEAMDAVPRDLIAFIKEQKW